MKNKLTVIGYRGDKSAYLNLSKEEAIRRFLDSNLNFQDCVEEDVEKYGNVEEFYFDDEFCVYDAWAK
jgi:1-deoxy-D-xylulose 5-phosphate reductoisomerase